MTCPNNNISFYQSQTGTYHGIPVRVSVVLGDLLYVVTTDGSKPFGMTTPISKRLVGTKDGHIWAHEFTPDQPDDGECECSPRQEMTCPGCTNYLRRMAGEELPY